MNSFISVIIPCYQQGKYLSEAVNSLQSQTHKNWEAIIVNDGSTDETESVAHFLAADRRVKYVSKPNGGLSSARNAGLRLSAGHWIQFLDADDLLLPQKFERHLQAAVGCGKTIMTYTDYFHSAGADPMRRVDKHRLDCQFRMSRPILDMAVRWEHNFSIPIHAAIFPASIFSSQQLCFDESLPNHEDWDFWMQVIPHIEKIRFIADELAIYRLSPQSMSREKSFMHKGFMSAIGKQKRCFRDDKEVMLGLRYLGAMVNYNYGYCAQARLRRLLHLRAFRTWHRRLQDLVREFECGDRPDSDSS